MNKITESMRTKQQNALPGRVAARDHLAVLDNFNVEYFYSEAVDFAQLFCDPGKSEVVDAFLDASQDNEDPTVLVFSRPGGKIFVVYSLDDLSTGSIVCTNYMYLDRFSLIITSLEDFLESV